MLFERVLGTERAAAVPADRLHLVILHIRHRIRNAPYFLAGQRNRRREGKKPYTVRD